MCLSPGTDGGQGYADGMDRRRAGGDREGSGDIPRSGKMDIALGPPNAWKFMEAPRSIPSAPGDANGGAGGEVASGIGGALRRRWRRPRGG